MLYALSLYSVYVIFISKTGKNKIIVNIYVSVKWKESHRDQNCISCISCIAGGLFTFEPLGKPRNSLYHLFNISVNLKLFKNKAY